MPRTAWPMSRVLAAAACWIRLRDVRHHPGSKIVPASQPHQSHSQMVAPPSGPEPRLRLSAAAIVGGKPGMITHPPAASERTTDGWQELRLR